MSFLKDVKVSKVSFVRRAANQRKFLLLKSDENDVNINNEEKYKPMRKEVREFLTKIFKSKDSAGKTVQEIVDTVKAQEDLKLSDDEIKEVTSFVEFQKDVTPAVEPDPKVEDKTGDKSINKDDKTPTNGDNADKVVLSKDEYNKLTGSIETLQKTVNTMVKTSQRENVLTFLKEECAFLPVDPEKTADLIMKMQEHDPDGAAAYKENLKSSSAALESSNMLKELGSSTEDLLKHESTFGDGFEFIAKFNREFSEIKKSADNGNVTPDQIANIIRSHGPEFQNYRVAHILRAKHNAI